MGLRCSCSTSGAIDKAIGLQVEKCEDVDVKTTECPPFTCRGELASGDRALWQMREPISSSLSSHVLLWCTWRDACAFFASASSP